MGEASREGAEPDTDEGFENPPNPLVTGSTKEQTVERKAHSEGHETHWHNVRGGARIVSEDHEMRLAYAAGYFDAKGEIV